MTTTLENLREASTALTEQERATCDSARQSPLDQLGAQAVRAQDAHSEAASV
eukprot:CAMPEP_0174232290 /NCGR_PEP_ID=MMETSP0417-20130205/2615_1 /TAXON_ID=242541 /ORGANISM="Mayorella sp, Strain BSH-02190019" /LENGTH=51 /DNA_ID=CAMNT_0015310311 /DNA_START=50 /DNA_END=201 /DNA_ORIENTATION=-